MNMSDQIENQIVGAGLRKCFLPDVQFRLDDGDHTKSGGKTITVANVPPSTDEPPGLKGDALPMLAIPEDSPRTTEEGDCLALVAVEGRDRQMARAITRVLNPSTTRIALLHVTWLPRTITSPLEPEGLDNPEPADLLLFYGARQALINTGNELLIAGFSVSTHLREDRDPARPLVEMIRSQRPNLLILGLGRHGAGIGRHILEVERIPELFVKAR